MAKPTGQLNTWDAELAEQAKVAAAAEAGTVERIFINMGNGAMSIGDARQPDDMLGCTILDALHVNTYYSKAYNATERSAPDCYALGRSSADGSIQGIDTWDGREELAPHRDVPAANRKCESCAACPLNQFGSATTGSGKGKACGNTRRLALVPAGTIVNKQFKPFSLADYERQKLHYLKLSPTNGKHFGAFVQSVANVANRPYYAVYTTIKRIPDNRTQYRVEFEFSGKIPDTHKEATLRFLDQAQAAIGFGFQSVESAPEPAQATKAGKAATKSRSKY